MFARIMRGGTKNIKSRRRTLGLAPIAFEANLEKDCDYLFYLPNGETMWLTYSEDKGPTVQAGMWPGDDKTYIEAQNRQRYTNAEELC